MNIQSAETVFIGTYTGGKSHGIYSARFDSTTGRLSDSELAAESRNPTFLALDSSRRFLYAANEIGDFGGKAAGSISVYKIDSKTRRLTQLNQQPSGGSGPCHLAVDQTGKWVFVANYGSGSVAALPVEDGGRLGELTMVIQHEGSSINKQRQEGPHAHFVAADPLNRRVLTCDLGLDKVLLYQFDAVKGLGTASGATSFSVKPGAGPRHLAFHPNGRLLFLLNEMACTVNSFQYDGTAGSVKELETVSTLPENFKGENTCAEIQVHPSGGYLYASNRGHNSIAVFSVDPKSGRLNSLGFTPTEGRTPRHFAIEPKGEWLLAENQDSDRIVVFRINPDTGLLSHAGEGLNVGSPVCLVFGL